MCLDLNIGHESVCCTVMLKYGKTCQDGTAVLHETPRELHFPCEMEKNIKAIKA